jgi:hypothetical protein
MSIPTNHRLIITDADGNTIRGRVMAVSRIGRGVANVVVATRGVLPLGKYTATYCTYRKSISGIYEVFLFSSAKNVRWPGASLRGQRNVRWCRAVA